MIELFEDDIKMNNRLSSKGNQLKWQKANFWYKADYTGYEGLAEYVISHLLIESSLKENEFVIYDPVTINYQDNVYNGAKSQNFLNQDWQIITLERLFKSNYGESLHKAVWTINDYQERLTFIVDQVEKMTGLKDFGIYMNKVLTIDAFFLNEDRHTHNLAVLMNKEGKFDYCPIFDNGAGLLADTTIDYPLSKDVFNLIKKVEGKTFSRSLGEQLEISEKLYGNNLKFRFTKKSLERILDSNECDMYSSEIKERVKTILFEQIRKYKYLFD